MNFWRAFLLVLAALPTAQAEDWPTGGRLSGNAFLPPGLLALQADPVANPAALWIDKGMQRWNDSSTGPSCSSCHGAPAALKSAASTFPRLSANGQAVVNLEDQIAKCRQQRTGKPAAGYENDDVLSLSALLHDAGKGQPIDVRAAAGQERQWQQRLGQGQALFGQRIGRINLACVHCHDQSIGRQMRAEVISPGHPTGFPIYRMSWQGMGSVERRLRACYSGVQAALPPSGAPELRDLELYLKVRANGLPLDGPSLRR